MRLQYQRYLIIEVYFRFFVFSNIIRICIFKFLYCYRLIRSVLAWPMTSFRSSLLLLYSHLFFSFFFFTSHFSFFSRLIVNFFFDFSIALCPLSFFSVFFIPQTFLQTKYIILKNRNIAQD